MFVDWPLFRALNCVNQKLKDHSLGYGMVKYRLVETSVNLGSRQNVDSGEFSSPFQVNSWLTWLETADEEGSDSEAE